MSRPDDTPSLIRTIAESSEDFVALAEALPHLVWVADPGGRITYVNERWIRYTGKNADDMAAEGRRDIVHRADRESSARSWRAALEKKQPYEVEYRLRCASDGTFRWFLGRAVPVLQDDGAIARWVGTGTDIDASRRATENVRFVLDCGNAMANLRDAQHICQRLAHIAVDHFADRCFIALDEGKGTYTAVAAGRRDVAARAAKPHAIRFPIRPDGSLAHVIATNAPLVRTAADAGDLQATALEPEFLDLFEGAQPRAVMILPISNGGPRDRALGALALFSVDATRSFDHEYLVQAETVARQAAAALTNAMAFEHERTTARLLRFLTAASERLTKSFDVTEAMSSILQLAIGEIADIAFVWNVHEGIPRISAVEARDPCARAALAQLIGQRPLRPDAEARLLRDFAQGEPYIVDDWPTPRFEREAFFEYAFEAFEDLSGASLMHLPFSVHGTAAGALVFVRKSESPHFTADEREILADLARRVSLAQGQASLFARERRISSELQRAMLPRSEMMPKVPGITFDAFYHPSSSDAEVGGDWYDAIALPDESIVISVGDVTGRGLGAAGLMGKLRQALGVVPLYERDPARMLDAVDLLLRRRGSEAIATAFIGVIDPKTETIRYANAGHPPPFLRRDGRVVALEANGLPLGLRDQLRGESVTASLKGAQALVLYTDGLVEATRDYARGERLLKSIVARNAMLFVKSPAKMLCDACLPNGAPDDAAVMVLQFSDQPRWSFDAEDARAARDARTEFIGYLRKHGCTGDFNAAEIIFGELIGNVVRHAPGPIDVNVQWRGIRAVIHVTDRGRGFDRKPALPDDMMKESGRGLYIVEALSRGFSVEYVPSYGTHVSTELPVERPASHQRNVSKPGRPGVASR